MNTMKAEFMGKAIAERIVKDIDKMTFDALKSGPGLTFPPWYEQCIGGEKIKFNRRTKLGTPISK